MSTIGPKALRGAVSAVLPSLAWVPLSPALPLQAHLRRKLAYLAERGQVASTEHFIERAALRAMPTE